MREVAVQEYESVEFYFKTICETTANAANSPSNKVGAQAYEFWTTLAEVELERKTKGTVYKKYIDNCKNELMPLVFSGLLKINFEEDEDDEKVKGGSASSSSSAGGGGAGLGLATVGADHSVRLFRVTLR